MDSTISKLTSLQRDYLAEIYHITRIEADDPDGFVSSGTLSERMLIITSTINRVLDRLRDADLIHHKPYVGVQLTPSGEREARLILRKQAIVEAFLVNTMGFRWHEICDEAKKIRHGVNETLVDRMWEIAGYPEKSPFGEPITADDAGEDVDTILTDTEIGIDYQIARVLTRQRDRLEYLAALDLTPGHTLKVMHQSPFDGPIQVQLDREYRIIGYELARVITVFPL
ncbi:MAG: metal-dependent transcriptional regulator [Chloroflexota bacterium]